MLLWLASNGVGVLDDQGFRRLHLLNGTRGRAETIVSHVAYLRDAKRPTYNAGPVHRLGSLTVAVRIQVVFYRAVRLRRRHPHARLWRRSCIEHALTWVTPARVHAALHSTVT